MSLYPQDKKRIQQKMELNKKVQKYVEEVIELDKAYKVENNGNEQKKILEKYNTLVDKYINEVGAPVYIKILYLDKGVIITKVE